MAWDHKAEHFIGAGSTDFGNTPPPPAPLRLSFTGSGSEYFRIWIVNALLTVVTLGIYSAWAKVRTLQYFYRNTRLDDAAFDYHGKPGAILKGRAIVLVLAMVVQFSGAVSPVLPLVFALVFGAVWPYLLVRSLRFRMANSSYRGLRFAFTGGDKEAYKVFLLWPILSMLTLGLLAPLAHQRFKHYQHNHTRFGTAPFAFDAKSGDFYGVYLRTGMVTALFMIVGALLSAIAIPAGADTKGGVALVVGGTLAFTYFGIMLTGPYFTAKLQNLVWSHTTLAPHRFESRVGAGRMIFITVTNWIAIALTCGLFLPFAKVRSTRYRVESVTMFAAGPLDAFVAGEAEQVGALGDAAVDWYDIDIAL